MVQHTIERGNRHFHPDLMNRMEASSERNGSVRIVMGPEWGATLAGQHLVWMLTSLLARQFGVVREIELRLPDVAPISGAILVPPEGLASTLGTSLENMIHMISPGFVHIKQSGELTKRANVQFCIGALADDDAEHTYHLHADGWKAWISQHATPSSRLPASSSSIGPYFCACLAAGEAFKRILELHTAAGEYIDELEVDLFEVRADSMPTDREQSPEVNHEMRPLYVVGAGAVGQAAIATLATSGIQNLRITVIDHDAIDAERTNLNRCVLSYNKHANMAKTSAVNESLYGLPVSLRLVPGTWQDFVMNKQTASMPAYEPELERAYKYRIVLSCVDKNVARHAVQRSWPEHLYGGSTNSFTAKVETHDMSSQGECLMCFNPQEAAESIEAAAKRFAAMPLEEQHKAASSLGLDAERMRAYAAQPKCGSPAEADLLKFSAGSQQPDASVGFVSVAAGVLLAATVLRDQMQEAIQSPEHRINFSFLRPKTFRRYGHRRSTSCICSTDGKLAYRTLWSGK
jgi:hypothetical protein